MTIFFALFSYAIIFVSCICTKNPSLERLKNYAAVKHDVSTSIVSDKPLIKPEGAAVEPTLLGTKIAIVLTAYSDK